jgi:hypothetical protein
MCGPWRYALGVSIFTVLDHDTCAAGGSLHRIKWWAMVDEVTVSERRGTIREHRVLHLNAQRTDLGPVNT